MAFEVIVTSSFKKDLKRIAKKHRQILKDINQLIDQLSKKPRSGTDLGQNIYKIRLAITGTAKGKSGGARVITYVKIIHKTVILSEIYLKSDFETVRIDDVIQKLFDEGLI